MPDSNASTITIEDLSGLTKHIHELDTLNSLTGREYVIVDNEIIDSKVTIDGLLGYFASRFAGDMDEQINIDVLNSAGCIHLIDDKDIPVSERIHGHYYLKLSDKEIDGFRDAYMEDADGKRYFLNNGKTNVKGILQPECFYNNDSYNYLKICEFDNINDKGDVYIDESFKMICINYTSDNYQYTKVSDISFGCLIKDGILLEDSISLLSVNKTERQDIKIYCVKKDDKISLWCDISNTSKVFIQRKTSIADNNAIENKNHSNNGYEVTFVNNNTVKNTDISGIIDDIGTILKESKNNLIDINTRIKAISDIVAKADIDIKYNSITFNESNPVNNEENQLYALNTRLIDTSTLFTKINTDGSISVSKDGFYSLTLKQGYRIVSGGESDLEMNVYVNESKIEDLNTEVSLSERFKISYATGTVTLKLFTGDKIKVSTKWSNPNITVTNNSSLQITKYMDTQDTIDFGDLDLGTYPYVGYAQVGLSRLLYEFSQNDNSLDINMHTLPLVDVATTDQSALKDVKKYLK